MAARNLFDFLEKSNKFTGRKQPPTSVQSRFLKISVYFLSIRISLRNFVGNIFNSDIMRKTAKKRKIERKDEKKKLLMVLV